MAVTPAFAATIEYKLDDVVGIDKISVYKYVWEAVEEEVELPVQFNNTS
jgi:hypothetical protein